MLPAREIHPSLWFKSVDQPALKDSFAFNEFARRRLLRLRQALRWTPDSPHNHLSKPAWGLGSLVLVRRDLSGKILKHFVRAATYLRVAGRMIAP